MLSSLFTTLDVTRQADTFEGASSQPSAPSQCTQNPVGAAGMVPTWWRTCGISVSMIRFQVVVVLQQVFPLIQTLLSRWLEDSEVVEVQREGGQFRWFCSGCFI